MGDTDNLPGAGQVGFGIDGVEDDKEVEIDLAQIHCQRAPDLIGIVLSISQSYIGDECLYTPRIG
ncbi:hypothetical protein GCM10017655_39030 [Pseudomonas turukhanskensis]|uniref:Uncharacterized protein n=1 Tax=Pseudomonas turukhanskensis TaxID=1806536 RepID=A0A9W6KA27_9PSED|nr:hypothetical protein GCM10017655_39030 [Pseudomonas turukhanskensis]